jgi:membrane fusion protein (multidrug efflux system)
MKRRTLLMFGLPVALVAALLLHGIVARERALASLTRVSAEQAIVPVQIISPQRGPPTRPLVLPGTVRAWSEAPIFAQVAGYVQSWNADFGATVKAGQLLATIDAPSLDAQYSAAKANLRVAQANYRLAVSTASRWQALAGTPAVSKQEVEVQTAGAAARKAEMEVSAQDVARYAALEAFKRVVAPFDGVVTSRLTDVGSYVNAAGGDVSVRGNSTELFTVADVHEMRVFV